jgi:hypothetical protein
MEDLESRLSSGTEYDLIMAAGLVRKLLVDSPSLTDQVNRHRLKLTFPANWMKNLIGARSTSGSLDIFDRDRAIEEAEASLIIHPDWSQRKDDLALLCGMNEISLDKFLGAVVFTINRHYVSVLELTKHLANYEGGAHFIKPRMGVELARWDDEVFGDLARYRFGRTSFPTSGACGSEGPHSLEASLRNIEMLSLKVTKDVIHAFRTKDLGLPWYSKT